MKPYRVKRGGKLIGNFIVVHGGQRVNLRTKDAGEARRRVALVARGEWPPEGNGEARAVKEALEAPPLEDSRNAGVVNDAGGAEVPPTLPVQPSAPPPADVPAGEAGAGAAMPAADAVNVAAAAGEAEDLDAAAKAALESAGLDLSEVQAHLPEWLGKAHLFLQAHALRVPIRFAMGKGHWPPYVKVEEPQLRDLIGKLWQQKLASMNVDLSKLTPGWWLLILSGVVAFSQTAAMLDAMAPPEATASPATTMAG